MMFLAFFSLWYIDAAQILAAHEFTAGAAYPGALRYV
jgi:hypothetical protein